MRLMTAIHSFLLILCSLRADAQVTDVYDNQMSSVDVAALKGGEWVETETMTEYPGMTQPTLKLKTACVRVDADSVWIESWVADQVTCFQVAKKDRRIVKAWTGKAGEEGKEQAVKPAPAAGPTPAARSETTGSGKVSKERISLGGKEFDCEKVEQEQVVKMSGIEIKSKITTWYSEGHPFKSFVDPNAKPVEVKDPIKWEGDKPLCKGAIVKMVTETNGARSTTQVCGVGSDAKPGLKMK